MATLRLRNAHQKIEEVRSRLFQQRWDTVTCDVHQRLHDLGKLIGTDAGDELHRHVVVSAVAALQTFYRGMIVSIVDSGEEYKARAAEKITEKFSMEAALSWLSGKTGTFGELIAHSAPCNSVTDLLSRFETLLACDMRQALAEAINPYDRRNGKESPERIVPDVDRLISSLEKVFRLRHIFAHEAAPSLKVTTEECRELHGAVAQCVEAMDAVLWATVYQHLPLTQYEMNMHTRSEVLEARKKLAKAMRKALSDARAAGSAAWLRRNHFAWMRATMDWAHETYGSLQGTMWPAVGGMDLAKAITSRAEQVTGWNRSQNLEESSE
ncbi:MAG: hypothetical protein LBE78_05010 [Burkholderiaceae bacterium]|jgi:hypothetical protein|nr:hypothetical protein [Burkholderiaceae bacterium]